MKKVPITPAKEKRMRRMAISGMEDEIMELEIKISFLKGEIARIKDTPLNGWVWDKQGTL